MDRDTVARIEEWEERPFSGGYGGLRELAGAEFSGAVEAGATWLFMLNGRVIGVFDGTMDAVEGADGTAYEAPHPSLPLLFAMRERGGETEARYYTDDTPLSEVDDTLREGSFTGYLELSENVLSGDYYVVYYGGRSLSAAFIGSEERLLAGEEAFERADDEVGIYEVRSVELEVTDVPEPEGSAAAGTGAPDDGPTDTEPDPDDAAAPTEAEPDETTPEPPEAPSGEEPPVDEGDGGAGSTPAEPEAPGEAGSAESPEPGDAASEPADTGDTSGTETPPVEEPGGSDAAGSPDDGPAEAGADAGERDPDEDPFSEEEEWRETRTIPALDPEESDVEGEAADGGATPPAEHGEPEPGAGTEPEAAADPSPEPTREPEDHETALREAVAERDETIDRLEAQLESVTAERDDLREELASVREERDRLRERVEQLEAADGAGAGGATAPTALDPEAALDQTDLFLRYGSKGEATLEEAHSGGVDRETVESNLRLEVHTRFDADDAAVGDRPFRAFLEDTLEYRFVEWVVHDLLYEIRDTGNEAALRELYDALPNLDRASFRDEVTVEDETGEEHSRTFDVTFRDRMGQPLIVANLNDDRDPASGEMMADLAEAATEMGEGHDTLGGAFLVTASFFEPDALETAAEATGGGLLNRGRKRSFVRLARKQGYHLCLVEARDEAFHVAVPEL